MRIDKQISILTNNIKIFLLVIGFAYNFLTGCEKKEDSDLVVAAPTITVTAPKEQLSYGSSTIFSWIAKGIITSVSLDGNIVQSVGSFSTPKLFGDTEYVLLATGPGGKTTQKIQIAVYVPTRTDTICRKGWRSLSACMLDRTDKSVIYNFWLTPEELERVFYFYKNGTAEGYRGGKIISNGTWKWSSPKTILLGDTEYFYTLTDTTFITYHDYSFQDGITMVTYWR